MSNKDFVVLVMDRARNTIVDSKIIVAYKYPSHEKFERAIARVIGCFERKYPEPEYVIHQGQGSGGYASSFLTVYPELVRRQ